MTTTEYAIKARCEGCGHTSAHAGEAMSIHAAAQCPSCGTRTLRYAYNTGTCLTVVDDHDDRFVTLVSKEF